MTISIENIGGGNWNSDICIRCTFEGEQYSEDRLFVYENLEIPYASTTKIEFVLEHYRSLPKIIIVHFNPKDMDSPDCKSYSEENFYQNNVYRVKIH